MTDYKVEVTAERRAERELIRQYREDIMAILPKVSRANLERAVALASLPEHIRGYGHIKEAAMEKAAARRQEMLKDFSAQVVSLDGARAA